MDKRIVCLGGGIGTVNLLKGIEAHTQNFCAVVSMADDGGSAGRLRRLYNIPPLGDLVSCMAAIKDPATNDIVSKLLTYRFPGSRYGQDGELGGHKVGNLILAALLQMTNNLNQAIVIFQDIFHIPGQILPATTEQVTISAKTSKGYVEREENIDLGKYDGVIEQVFLHPQNAKASQEVIQAIEKANVIIAGPGDLYTTILPVLIIPSITKALMQSKAIKLFVVNVANKPFETKGYSVDNYIQAITKHLGSFPFQKVIINNNYAIPIPEKYHYTYVMEEKKAKNGIPIICANLVDEQFPLYHDSIKLAKVIYQHI